MYRKEAIVDRLMVRPKSVSPGKESWHRDEAKNALVDDIVLGGWWNFDDSSNFLSCIPSSHAGVVGNGGFSLVPKENASILNTQSALVEVPRGCILLFNEKILHEVRSKRLNYVSYRLFLGWRLTKSDTPLDTRLIEKLETQAPMQIKSGQEPMMWSTLHRASWIDKLEKFSERFSDKCKSCIVVKSGKNAGKQYNIVHRRMKSLMDYEFRTYDKYSNEEVYILLPH